MQKFEILPAKPGFEPGLFPSAETRAPQCGFGRLLRLVRAAARGDLPGKIVRLFRRRRGTSPEFILIQAVASCNLRCDHCFLTDYGTAVPDGKRRLLKLEEFARLADAASEAIRRAYLFQFSSFEALLHPDLFRMMDHVLAINPRIRFPMLSNGMLVTERVVKRLEEYPIHDINISLDGTDAATVEAFKTGVRFEKVVEALALLGKSKLGDRLGCVFVVHKNNFRQLADLPDLVRPHGVRTIYVNNILSFTARHRDFPLYRSEGNAEVEEIFRRAVERATANGQSIHLPLTRPAALGCAQAEGVVVDPDGNVSACDFLAVSTPFEYLGSSRRGSPLVFGNVLERDLLEIYTSPAFAEFRRNHAAGQVPDCCSHCIDAYGLMCSNRTLYRPIGG